MIQIQHLTKRFAAAGATVVALNDINLEIQDGDIYGIIGMSGAGKSTLVRCINMLERPDEGNVIVNGKQMQDLRAADLREDIQNRLDELQRRFDERASRLSRTRRSLLRGNPTARSAQYDAVLQKLKKHLER